MSKRYCLEGGEKRRKCLAEECHLRHETLTRTRAGVGGSMCIPVFLSLLSSILFTGWAGFVSHIDHKLVSKSTRAPRYKKYTTKKSFPKVRAI